MLFELILSAILMTQATPPSGSVEGVVLNSVGGDPIYRATVTLSGEKDEWRDTATTTTDRDGRFVFSGLPAASYRVNASRNGFVLPRSMGQAVNPPIELAADQKVRGVTLRLTPTGTVSGRVYDSEGEGLANMQVQLLRSAYQPDGSKTLSTVQSVTTNDLGEYRLFWIPAGHYYIRSDVPQNQARMNAVADNFVSTFYPGTVDELSAVPIDVSAGAFLAAIDFALARTKTFRIRGRLISPVAPEPRNAISVVLVRQDTGTMIFSTAVATHDLSFEIPRVQPGRYYLIGSLNGTARLDARLPIEITNSDLDGFNVVLSEGFPLSGRVLTEGAEPDLETPPKFTIKLTPRDKFTPPPQDAPARHDDGVFTIPMVLPGSYQLVVLGLAWEYYVKSSRLGSVDVLHDGLNIDRKPETPLEIVVHSNAGEIDGRVVDKDGNNIPMAAVTLLPSDRDRSDLYKMANSDGKGNFHFMGLAPGEYKLFAWTEIESGAQRDPDFMRKYENLGTVVKITEGSVEKIDLRLREPWQ
jgi:hypothetical protein